MSWRAGESVVLFVLLYLLLAITPNVPTSAEARSETDANDPIVKAVAYLKNKRVPIKEEKLKRVVHAVYRESRRLDLDYRLTLAVISAESSFRQDAVSNKGARGLMQIMPSLARCIAQDAGVKYSGDDCLHQPEKNIRLGVYHLARLVEDFKNLPTALHAYNAGETRVRARTSNKEPSTAYTKQIMEEYRKSLDLLPEAGKPTVKLLTFSTTSASDSRPGPSSAGVSSSAGSETVETRMRQIERPGGKPGSCPGGRGLPVLPFRTIRAAGEEVGLCRMRDRRSGEIVLTAMTSLARPFSGDIEASNQSRWGPVPGHRHGASDVVSKNGAETGHRDILRA